MNTEQMKIELIDAINSTEDEKLLKGLARIIRINEQEENLFVFTADQNFQIDHALEQIENGEFLTEEEAEKEVDLWLED